MYPTNTVEKVIERVAYRIYQQRMREGRPGDAKQDWFDALKEIGIITKEDL